MKGFRFPQEDKYPKYIYFAKEKYSVSFRKKMDCFGWTDSGKKEIVIKSGMAPRQTFTTFVHELCHVIEFEQPLKIKHKLIYKLERAVVELILDNFV